MVLRWCLWRSFRIFSTFSVVFLVLGHPEHLSSSADTRLALKRECHSKTAVRLKERSPKASQSISRVFNSRFTELHAKLDADMLLDFAFHRSQGETRSQKNAHVKKQCMFTVHCHVAD
jgi:hypothetical protein